MMFMAKAIIKRPDGTAVSIEGTPQEIAELVRRVETHKKIVEDRRATKINRGPVARASLPDLLLSLIDGGFFKKPKDLAAIKSALAELGHVYPVTTLSPAMIRRVRRRLVRRIKQDNRWFYTG